MFSFDKNKQKTVFAQFVCDLQICLLQRLNLHNYNSSTRITLSVRFIYTNKIKYK